jgi:peptidyl-prolyl cis-trans isomerase B (cyclophilin B)
MKKIITLIMIGSIIMTSCEKQPDVAVVSTRYGDMVLEFYPEVAEKHVDSFLTHARNGYFNGTTFHRVIPGFVIQGGDPNSKSDDRSTHGMGGHAANFYGIGQEDDSNSWMLPAEFNSRPHLTGTLSMARSQSPNSAGSQFFICAGPTPQLDNQYTVFGQVVEGLDVIQKIVNSPRDRRDNPKDKVEMNVSVMPRDEALDE